MDIMQIKICTIEEKMETKIDMMEKKMETKIEMMEEKMDNMKKEWERNNSRLNLLGLHLLKRSNW